MSTALAEPPREIVRIAPQKGQQTKFLASPADIAFYGGAAGGGKSYGLLLKPMAHITRVKGYSAVIFRKTSPQIRQQGGLWETSQLIYSKAGATPREGMLDWTFAPHGNMVKFNHLENDKHLIDHQGGQYPFIGLDEGTHFSRRAFFFLLSRNRSPCGIRPMMRITCNPDPGSWVAEFISWWIDPATGYPIPERDGVLRYFVRRGDEIIWASSIEELPVITDDRGNRVIPKSVTFIRSSIYDNPALLSADPTYLASLMSLGSVEMEQLLKGNWKIRRAQGTFFRRMHARIVSAAPAGGREVVYWDRAATEEVDNNDPDWTVGVHMRAIGGQFYVLNVIRFRGTPKRVEEVIKNYASQHPNVPVVLEQDPGQAGIAEVGYLTRALAGFQVHRRAVNKNKVTRALPLVAQWEAGNVLLVRAAWNDPYLTELEGFGPDPKEYAHDDQVDGSSGAFNFLTISDNSPGFRSLA